MTSFQALERPDHWAATHETGAVHYQLVGDAQPDLLCRVLNLLAMQYLVPQSLAVLRHGGLLHIDLHVDGVTWHRAGIIGHKMRNLIDVEAVELSPSVDWQSPETLALGRSPR